MRAIEAGLRWLHKQGVQYIFGIPAGSINAIYDALLDIPELKTIVAKHESTAGYMATAYSRLTGIPSICVGSSGPGATNLVTPAANAWREKLPVIFITGSIPTTKFGMGGGQELYAEPIFASVTKWSITATDAKQLPNLLAEAYEKARSGVPGPVHLAIPINIQMTDIGDWVPPAMPLPEVKRLVMDEAQIISAANLIQAAGSRGALLLGHGAKASADRVRQFAERTGWMVATTPRGKGAFPENHPLSLGVYGLSGNRKAVEFLHGSNHEVLMVIGSSLGESATSNWEPKLVEGKQLIHIDHDPRELGKCFETKHPIRSEIQPALEQLLSLLAVEAAEGSEDVAMPSLILEEAAAAHESHAGDWNTLSAIQRISACAPKDARYYIDIGEFMTYSIQSLLIQEGQQFDININFGGMGSGIGGAIGAQLAEPERPILCITGDGCFFMHGFEVLTAKEYGLPIIFIVINNARLGMVYHGHMMQYHRCPDDFSQERISIAGVAESLGLHYAEVRSLDQLQQRHMTEWLSVGKPVVVEIIVDGNETPPMGERVKFLQGATY